MLQQLATDQPWGRTTYLEWIREGELGFVVGERGEGFVVGEQFARRSLSRAGVEVGREAGDYRFYEYLAAWAVLALELEGDREEIMRGSTASPHMPAEQYLKQLLARFLPAYLEAAAAERSGAGIAL